MLVKRDEISYPLVLSLIYSNIINDLELINIV